MPAPQVAVLVESYNETEHSTVERLAASLAAAERAARSHGDACVVLADSGGNPAVARLLAERFPGVRRVVPTAAGYDRAKAEAAAASGARIVAFLDGDCLPTGDDWLATLVAPIAAGEAAATAGFTRYEGGWFAAVQSVMDFGFLLPRESRVVGCYASNNSAFDTATLARVPAPECELRCACFPHAQELLRQGERLQLVPGAVAYHEQVPVVAERLRRGWDLVEAARVDPHLREARWLRVGVLAAPLFLLRNVALDARRALADGAGMGLRPAGRIAALPVMLGLRLVDAVGIVAALRGRPVPGS